MVLAQHFCIVCLLASWGSYKKHSKAKSSAPARAEEYNKHLCRVTYWALLPGMFLPMELSQKC
jgi:hypothetical protein